MREPVRFTLVSKGEERNEASMFRSRTDLPARNVRRVLVSALSLPLVLQRGFLTLHRSRLSAVAMRGCQV
jgi:hypothetical protein